MDRQRRLFLQGALAAAMTAATGGLLERHRLQLERVDVAIPHLPPGLAGLRIALLTDLHVGHYAGPEQAAHAVALANSLRADLVVVGGDLVHDGVSARDLTGTAAALAHLRSALGTWVVLGNHDLGAGASRVEAALAGTGLHLLVNAGQALTVRGSNLWLAGVDDVWLGRPDLARALQGAPGDAARLLLSHAPDYADTAAPFVGDAPALQLSGHSHGGQVRLPGMGALHLPPWGRKYPIGLQRVPGSRLQVYTSRGIGVTGPPLRFLCPPEVTLLRLHSS